VIQVENVSKNYRSNGDRTANILQGVSLKIPEGEFVCILGPSGCGKTTLLNLIAGFIKPSSGTILFNGGDVSGPGPERGVVFQDATLFPWLTVRQNVEFGLRQQGISHEVRGRTATGYLDLVGMAGHADAYPHTLSGGMRQRTAIARVLALEPEALLMDEPFSSLDANAREHLQDELLRIWQHRRRTLIYITHSVEEAAYLADRVIVMGPAPDNIRRDIALSPNRIRERTSDAIRETITELRTALDALPCCVGNKSIGNNRL
jgi:NitT/TauT family transport system ATP-binding protein